MFKHTEKKEKHSNFYIPITQMQAMLGFFHICIKYLFFKKEYYLSNKLKAWL